MLKNLNILFVTSFAIIFGVVISINSSNSASSQSIATTICPSGISLLINNMVQTTTTVNNIATIGVTTQGISSTQISKVIIFADNQPIGRALPTQNVNYSWEMQWVPGLKPIGTTVRLTAQLYYSNTTTSNSMACSTNPVYVTNQSSRAAVLQATNTPATWAGPMGTSFSIKIVPNVIEPSFDPTQYAIYEWSTTIGYLNPNQNVAQFTSGTTMGSGIITVKVIYGGGSKMISIPITINATTAPLPTANNSTSASPSSATTSNPAASSTKPTTSATITPTTTVQNPTAQDCVINAIGKDRFTQINTGASRPTPEELAKFNACFATSNFILPSNFAPVAPSTVQSLKYVDAVKVNSLKNETKSVNNVDKQVIKISGKATPNSVVYIYIFSDPLVLTTKSNSNGDWEYTLEDPIESGKHELFSVVNRGDGVYERSKPISFVMGEAQAASVNPDGLSLKLVGTATPVQSQRSLGYYIAGSATILVFSIIVFIFSLSRKSKSKMLEAQSVSSSQDIAKGAVENTEIQSDQNQVDKEIAIEQINKETDEEKNQNKI